MGLSSQRQRWPGGCFLGSAGRQAILLPSMNSTTWFSRTAPLVNVVLNTSPTWWTRCPGAADARLLLPSQLGWMDGSAIRSNILSALAEITRVALTIPSGDSGSMKAIQTPLCGAVSSPAPHTDQFPPLTGSQGLDRPGQSGFEMACEVVGQ